MRLSALNALNFPNEKIRKTEHLGGIFREGDPPSGLLRDFLRSVGRLVSSIPSLWRILYPTSCQTCQRGNGPRFSQT